ncbi:hypothetical protein CJS40_18110 [Salmonella enterica subsp. enterica serovar Aberdeen]|nr:hypothetical protein CJS40_18110 [Salmonella enterica subsp. enterica serovar Aberdeen]
MTQTDIRGYILHTPAKSGVGIGLPDVKRRQRRASVFFIVVCIATPSHYGGLAGALRRAGSSYPVRPTPSTHHP